MGALFYINLNSKIQVRLSILPIIRIFCVIIFTIEINRHPFEIIEGESELVSGFNVELSSVIFIVFFLSEIINITTIVIIISLVFKSSSIYVLLILLILAIRSRFPRIRYDILMIFQ